MRSGSAGLSAAIRAIGTASHLAKYGGMMGEKGLLTPETLSGRRGGRSRGGLFQSADLLFVTGLGFGDQPLDPSQIATLFRRHVLGKFMVQSFDHVERSRERHWG